MNSIVLQRDLPALRKKNSLKKIVLAGGGLDLLHPGHFNQLLWAKAKGDILIVHVTGDKRYIEKRGRKPVFSDHERAYMLSQLKPVDFVFIYNGRHYDKKIIELLEPDVLVFNKEAFSEEVKKSVSQLAFSGTIAVSKFSKKYSSSIIRGQA